MLRTLIIMAALITGHASAAQFCVDSSNSLHLALLQSADNNEDDEIRLKPGTYVAPANGFTLSLEQPDDLVISGGWKDLVVFGFLLPCVDQVYTVWETVIDANHGGPGFAIALHHDATTFEFSDLLIRNGLSSSHGGGLSAHAVDDAAPTIIVRDSVFIQNTAVFGGALSTSTGGTMTITNNLIALNTALIDFGGVDLWSGDAGMAFVSSNTIVENAVDANGAVSGGMRIGGPGDAILANNLYWSNEGTDLTLADLGAPFALLHNAYDTVSGVPATTSSGNLIGVPPTFQAGDHNYRLARESLLADAGTDAAGGLAATDLDGLPRIIGPVVDIGAFENDLVFASGFGL